MMRIADSWVTISTFSDLESRSFHLGVQLHRRLDRGLAWNSAERNLEQDVFMT